MPATRELSLKAVLPSIVFCLLLLPTEAGANPKSEFREMPCPGQKDCVCSENSFCVRPSHVNNRQYVHFRIYSFADYYNVKQGSRQFGAKTGEQVYVNRSGSGSTSFGVQYCKKPGSDCGGWVNFTLPEPTVGQLEDCENYANEAVAAAKGNVKYNCGYVGGRWADDYKAHYNACAFAPGSPPILAEIQARRTDLQTCKNKSASQQAQPAPEPAKPAPWTPPPLPVGTLLGTWDTKMSDRNNYTLNIMPSGDVLNASIGAVSASLDGTLQFSFLQDNKRMNFVLTQPGIGAVSRGAIQLTDDDHFTGSLTTDGNGAQRNWTGARRK